MQLNNRHTRQDNRADQGGSRPPRARWFYGYWLKVALLGCLILAVAGCSRLGPAEHPAQPDLRPLVQPDSSEAKASAGLDQPDELDHLDELDEFDALDQLDSKDETEPQQTDSARAMWQERSFKGNTRYSVSGTGVEQTIKGESNSTASLFYRQQTIDVSATPWMNWRWKISNTYGDEIDEKTRAGDDYPARLYVVVQTGLLPWDTRAVNYVWSSNNAIGDSWDNPFTEHAKMVVIQSGEQLTGQWVDEKRNIVEDFKNLFNLDITSLDGYAVMVDGDNSGNQATGWFRGIQFSTH